MQTCLGVITSGYYISCFGSSTRVSADGEKILISESLGGTKGTTYVFSINLFQFNICTLLATLEGELSGDEARTTVNMSKDGRNIFIAAIQNDQEGTTGSGHVTVYNASI